MNAMPDAVLQRFHVEWERALDRDVSEPTAVILATADAAGQPSSRAVLLKGVDARGFVFYTNLGSRKARQLAANPRAALTFYWPELEEQVQVEGTVELVSDAEADAYWSTRSRTSRVGAWASRQSETLRARSDLVKRVAVIGARHVVGEVPRPDFWSGYRLQPQRVEFWRARPHRLHERELWEWDDGGWTTRRLYP